VTLDPARYTDLPDELQPGDQVILVDHDGAIVMHAHVTALDDDGHPILEAAEEQP